MTREELLRLHQLLGDFELFTRVRKRLEWDDQMLETIRTVAIMVEKEVSKMAQHKI